MFLGARATNPGIFDFLLLLLRAEKQACGNHTMACHGCVPTRTVHRFHGGFTFGGFPDHLRRLRGFWPRALGGLLVPRVRCWTSVAQRNKLAGITPWRVAVVFQHGRSPFPRWVHFWRIPRPFEAVARPLAQGGLLVPRECPQVGLVSHGLVAGAGARLDVRLPDMTSREAQGFGSLQSR